MAKHLFTSENQPENRGRRSIPKEEKVVQFTCTLKRETKEWYTKRKGLARKILEEYKKSVCE